MGLQVLGVQQFTGQDRLLLVLVGIEGGDALLGGAVLLVLQALLLQGVQLPVPGQQQTGPLADQQVLGGDVHAALADGVDLLEQILAVQGHAVAQDVHDTGAENAGGQQMQGELALFVDDSVPGVAAALIAHHHIILLGEVVHHAALALVAPVDTHDRAI